ncbi:MAG: sialate O-acetylesterase [Planctomycetota bacterium]
MRERSGGPILIIKAAWGGKSLHTDFRPPSAGKYEFSEKQIQQMRSRGKDVAAEKAKRDEASGHFYRLMLNHVRETLAKPESVLPAALAQRGCRLEGFVWFQGWNDMVDGGVYPTRDQPGGYAEYSRLMRMFISDVRKDLGANELPFVIGVLGVNGPTRLYSDREKRYVTVHQNFRDAMAEPAAGKSPVPNVFAVRTENAWDQQLAAAVGVRKQIQQWERRQKQNPGQQPDNPKPQLSEEQEALLEAGVSNAEYHYLGSSKILTSIGTAFADALPTAQ